MDSFKAACGLLPQGLREDMKKAEYNDAEEIRLRLGLRPSIVINGTEFYFSGKTVDESLLRAVLERATGASVHSYQSAIAQGFVPYGEIRIGLCGQAAVHDGRFSSFRNYTSLCMRIPHDCRGAYSDAAEQLLGCGLPNTLIVSPAGGGKTTALREIVRELSDRGVRIGVVDERFELCGAEPHRLGRCSDVISGLSKREASIMLLRAVNPRVIAMDEISSPDDSESALNTVGCGSTVIATVHGKSLADMKKRQIYRELIDADVFEMILTIEQQKYGRTYTLERICK